MKKADREKIEAFILAELADGGTLVEDYGRKGAAPRALKTKEGIMIELPSTAPARELINSMRVVKKPCEPGFHICPLTPFDAKAKGKRRTIYRVPKPPVEFHVPYYNRTQGDTARFEKDNIIVATRIVTPFGTFGACGGEVFDNIDDARTYLVEKLEELVESTQLSTQKKIDEATAEGEKLVAGLEKRVKKAFKVKATRDE